MRVVGRKRANRPQMVEKMPEDLDYVLKSIEEKKMEVRRLTAQIEADKTYVREVMQGSKEMRTPKYIVKNTSYVTVKALSLKEIAERHGERMALALSKETESQRLTISANKDKEVVSAVRTEVSENAPKWVKIADLSSRMEEE